MIGKSKAAFLLLAALLSLTVLLMVVGPLVALPDQQYNVVENQDALIDANLRLMQACPPSSNNPNCVTSEPPPTDPPKDPPTDPPGPTSPPSGGGDPQGPSSADLTRQSLRLTQQAQISEALTLTAQPTPYASPTDDISRGPVPQADTPVPTNSDAITPTDSSHQTVPTPPASINWTFIVITIIILISVFLILSAQRSPRR